MSATIRPDFSAGTPPTCTCGRLAHLLADDTGDGWALSWSCDCDEFPEDLKGYGDVPWPFVEDSATWRDFEAAGFEVWP